MSAGNNPTEEEVTRQVGDLRVRSQTDLRVEGPKRPLSLSDDDSETSVSKKGRNRGADFEAN
jgi:hypothetical protein